MEVKTDLALMQPLPEPYRRCQINLFDRDVAQLEARYGRGWSEQVRLLVRKNCEEYRRAKDELDAIFEEQHHE